MIKKTISVTFGKKKQIEQFEPIENIVSITASLEDGDVIEEVARELFAEAKVLVGEDIMRNYKEKREKEKLAELKKFVPEGTEFDPVSKAIEPTCPSSEALAFAAELTPPTGTGRYSNRKQSKPKSKSK